MTVRFGSQVGALLRTKTQRYKLIGGDWWRAVSTIFRLPPRRVGHKPSLRKNLGGAPGGFQRADFEV